MKQVLKNHVAILLDTSTSMDHLLRDVETVFNNQINYLRESSLRFDQETRVSIYTFDNTVNCLISDVDVARPMEIGRLRANGMTALLDSVGTSVRDLKELPQRYGDHSFLIYLLTDGGENASRQFDKSVFRSLPDNFTIAAFAPNTNCVRDLKFLGIPEGNIDKWDTTQRGIEEVGRKFEKTMDNYYTSRSQGVRTFSTMFSDLNKVTASDVKSVAKEIKNYDVVVNEKTQAVHIKPLVEEKIPGYSYRKGCSFYELVKNETVQEDKEVAVQEKKSGKVYKGYEARQLLNLPNHGAIKINAADYQNSKWVVYIQSNAVNRNVIPKQRVLVIL